ncbi:MFS transporter [Sporofaciens musculi]|uniref:MFS transporter n=1 Tax=Sporofaciens musculi TaxID=2681861 RepID=UPI0025A19615|nr:MFS transporter [Sporofaciens musculi]
MSTMKKSYWIGFSVLEVSYWSFHASFIGFLMSYLLTKGITNTVVSIFLASYLLAAFLGSFIWGMVCDRFHTNRKVSILCFLAAGVLMYLIYFSYESILVLAVLYPLLGFVSLPHATNIDSWLLLTCENNLSIYGKIRCLPSLMFAITSVILGQLVSAFGYHFMLIFGTFFLLTGITAAVMLPDSKDAAQEKPAGGFSVRSLKQMFSSCSNDGPGYSYLIIILLLVGLAVAPINNLKTAVLQSVGGTVADIGIDAFICAITQVPFIALADKLEKYSLRLRYILIALLPFLTMALAFGAVSPVMIFAGSCLLNMGVGIMLPTMRSVTERNVAPAYRNLGHNIADAVYNSVAGIVSLLYSGFVIDRFGVKSMLFLCILIVSIPVIITLYDAVRHWASALRLHGNILHKES